MLTGVIFAFAGAINWGSWATGNCEHGSAGVAVSQAAWLQKAGIYMASVVLQSSCHARSAMLDDSSISPDRYPGFAASDSEVVGELASQQGRLSGPLSK